MKQIYAIIIAGFVISTLITGCDVTSNSPGGTSSTQEGDAVVVDLPIAYIQRPVPVGLLDEDDVQMVILPDDIMDPTTFTPGAQLILKDRASPSAATNTITDGVFPTPTPNPDNPSEVPPASSYDVRDLSVNVDATKLVFSMRAPEIEGVDEDEQPTWNIWEYDLETGELIRVIESNIIAEAGHDRFPIYLSDDSIVFSSTRQRASKSILLDQSRPQYAYVTERDDESRAFTLHRIDEDRALIEQISFGKGHDIYPTLLEDGRILFARGDDTSNANRDRLSLYTINPDGSNLSLHYGFHSPSGSESEGQGALVKPLQMPDGKLLVSYRPRETDLLGGDIYTVDTANYTDLMQPTMSNLGATEPAEASLSFGEVVLEDQSPHGYFNSAYPINDGTDRLLVSWMPCLVQGFRFGIYVDRIDTITQDEDGNIIDVDTRYELIDIDGQRVDRDGDPIPEGEAPVEIALEEIISLPCTNATFDNENISPAEPQFGIWIYDPNTQTQDPVVFANELGTMYTEAVVFEPRTPPTLFIPEQSEFRQALIDQNVGVIDIRSIYDFDGVDVTPNGIAAMADPTMTPADSRPVRFVRFWEEANMPHEDEYEIDEDLVEGRNNSPGRGIIGYAEVHPDGSVRSKVPANVAFSMEFIDANGRRVTGALGIRHLNWLSVSPGEVLSCNGCHTAASDAPHGRPNAQPESANEGALAEIQFPNTQLSDRFDTPYSDQPQIGETMAQYYTRVKGSDTGEEDPLAPSIDIVFTDEWTDPTSGATPGEDISLIFGVPDPVTDETGPDNLKTQPPVLIGDCLNEWSSLCRIVIDYPDHIQPIFEYPRVINVNGVDVDITCLNCHSPMDVDGNAQVPAPDAGNLQLDFSPVISNLDNDMVLLKGYDEFFAAGDPLFEIDADTGLLVVQMIQLVINGVPQFEQQQVLNDNGIPLFEATDENGNAVCVPQDTMDPTITLLVDGDGNNIPCLEPVYEVDDEGNLVLDDFGQPIPVPVLVPNEQGRYLSAQGANAAQNQRFFAVFEPGAPHAGYLTPAELKLFSEYLDVGGQYYNEIFKALED